MHTHFKKSILFALAITLISFSVNGQTDETKKDVSVKKWNFLVEAYFLFPSMKGETGIGNLPNVAIDADTGDIFSQLSGGAMLYFEADIEKWAFSSDLVYMNLGKGLDAEPSNLVNYGSIELKQLIWDLGAFRKILPCFDAGLGLRLIHIDANAKINRNTIMNGPQNASNSGSETWLDPTIIARFHNEKGNEFLYQLRMDIGGFGIGSDFTWQAQAYLGYRFSDLFQATAGYRYLGVDYENGSGSDRFAYNVDTSGPVVRVGFNF